MDTSKETAIKLSENLKDLHYIGELINNWRKRNVLIYAIPNEPDYILTIGTPFDKSYPPVICIENYSDWEGTIERINESIDKTTFYN